MIKSVWEFKEGKQQSLKSLQFKDEPQGIKDANLSLKKCVPPTTSGPEHKAPDSPCNTVIHWGVHY